MKKTALIALALLLAGSMMTGCSSDKKQSANLPIQEPQMSLVGTSVINDSNYPEEVTTEPYTETYFVIEEDAPIQTLDDITGFAELMAVYESCVNRKYMIEYDSNTSFAGENGLTYYAVTAPADTEEALRTELEKYLDTLVLNSLWEELCFTVSEDGKLYYAPADLGSTYDISEASISRSTSDMCEIDVTFTESDGATTIHSIELEPSETGYKIVYVTRSAVNK